MRIITSSSDIQRVALFRPFGDAEYFACQRTSAQDWTVALTSADGSRILTRRCLCGAGALPWFLRWPPRLWGRRFVRAGPQRPRCGWPAVRMDRIVRCTRASLKRRDRAASSPRQRPTVAAVQLSSRRLDETTRSLSRLSLAPCSVTASCCPPNHPLSYVLFNGLSRVQRPLPQTASTSCCPFS